MVWAPVAWSRSATFFVLLGETSAVRERWGMDLVCSDIKVSDTCQSRSYVNARTQDYSRGQYSNKMIISCTFLV